MAKRKKSRPGKKSARARKGSARRSEASPRAQVIDSALFTAPDPPPPFTTPPRAPVHARGDALTPRAALPESKRERQTRGGKSTLPTHELLAEVPPPPRAKPAPPKNAPPKAKPAQSKPPQSRPAQSKSTSPRPAPQRPSPKPKAPSEPRRPMHPSVPLPALDGGQALSMSQIYETLAALLVPYARKMESEMHPKIGFCLKAKSARTGRETHFGAVQALPDGVAFHLFPLYGHPDLLETISPDLFSRMRGATCFHFDSLHAGLVAELAQLTHAGFERFLNDGVF